jgi:hypothetical protein
MTYKVFIDDNFHYMDESERYELGEFSTLEAAIEASKKIVDEYLRSAYRPGMIANELSASYTLFGEDPFIIDTSGKSIGVLFSARDYASRRSAEMCVTTGPQDNEGRPAHEKTAGS